MFTTRDTTTTTTNTTNTANSTNKPSNIGTHGHSGSGMTAGTDNLVKTGEYATGLERGGMGMGSTTTTAVPIVGNSYQNRVSGVSMAPAAVGAPAAGDGLAVNNGLGGPLGGNVTLGGQCECTMNGGTCQHAAGKCVCRGCTTRATTVNPGINMGVSTTQYTAPVGTTGIGGGVADPGVGMAGVMHPVNAGGTYVNPTDANCECVKNGGTCDCPPGACKCENCSAKRSSMHHTSAVQGQHHHHHGGHHQYHHNNMLGSDMNKGPIGGTEYAHTAASPDPDAQYKTSTTNMAPVNTAGQYSEPLTDNSNVPYKTGDYTQGKPVTGKAV